MPAAQLDANARQLALGVGLHLPAIEQPEGAAAGRLAPQEDVAGDVQRVDQLALLVDDPDAEPGRVGRSMHLHRRIVYADLARVGPMNPRQDLHQRRFARSVFADESHDLAGRDIQIHAVERDDPGKALGDRRHF